MVSSALGCSGGINELSMAFSSGMSMVDGLSVSKKVSSGCCSAPNDNGPYGSQCAPWLNDVRLQCLNVRLGYLCKRCKKGKRHDLGGCNFRKKYTCSKCKGSSRNKGCDVCKKVFCSDCWEDHTNWHVTQMLEAAGAARAARAAAGAVALSRRAAEHERQEAQVFSCLDHQSFGSCLGPDQSFSSCLGPGQSLSSDQHHSLLSCKSHVSCREGATGSSGRRATGSGREQESSGRRAAAAAARECPANRINLSHFPRADGSEGETHKWSEAKTAFKIRGPNWKKSNSTAANKKAKIPIGEPFLGYLELVACDIINCQEDLEVYSRHQDSFVQQLRRNGERRFLFIVNMRFQPHAVINVFASDSPDLPDVSVFRDFIHTMNDAQRKKRFKLIPTVVEGGDFLNRFMIPALVTKDLTSTFIHERSENWFEVSCNINSSWIARQILGLVKGGSKGLVMDVGYVIQGETERELPERYLGGWRGIKADLDRARILH